MLHSLSVGWHVVNVFVRDGHEYVAKFVEQIPFRGYAGQVVDCLFCCLR